MTQPSTDEYQYIGTDAYGDRVLWRRREGYPGDVPVMSQHENPEAWELLVQGQFDVIA